MSIYLDSWQVIEHDPKADPLLPTFAVQACHGGTLSDDLAGCQEAVEVIVLCGRISVTA